MSACPENKENLVTCFEIFSKTRMDIWTAQRIWPTLVVQRQKRTMNKKLSFLYLPSHSYKSCDVNNQPCKGTGIITSAPWGPPICLPDIILSDLSKRNATKEAENDAMNMNILLNQVQSNWVTLVTQSQRLTLLTCWSLKLYHWPSLKDLMWA